MFPPGCARLAISPVPTGSGLVTMTMGIALVAFLAAWAAGSPAVTRTSSLRRISSANTSGSFSDRPAAYRCSMTMFLPSKYPNSSNPCCKAATKLLSISSEPYDRYPISGTFFGCCASAMTATASNTTATRIDGTAALFIAHLIWSVIYHANRGKGKYDLHGGRRYMFVEYKGQSHAETE